MGIFGVIIVGMVALDYRRLGRRPISTTQVERLKREAIVQWPLSADELQRAQRVERRRRWQRIQAIIRRNLRVATILAVVGGAALTLLVVFSTASGRTTFDASQLLIVLFPAIVIYPIILVTTVFVGGDALGVAGLRSVLGLQTAQSATVYVHQTGMVWEPGGFQPFTYSPTAAEILDGEQNVLLIVTTRGQLRQDFYLPIPTGHMAETTLVLKRLHLQA